MDHSKSSKSKILDLHKTVSFLADSPAFITDNKILNYADYFHLTSNTAQNLKTRGFKAGDRIAILSKNSIEYVILLMAIIRMKAVAVPLSIRYPINQIIDLLFDINCKNILYSDEIHSRSKQAGINFLRMNQLIDTEKRDNQPAINEKIFLDQDATIIFTSGSTSFPKAVLHTFGNHYFSALGSNQNISFQKGNKWLLSLPLYHVGGLAILFRALIGGGSVIIPDKIDSLSDSILKFQPTHISLVSTQLYRLMNDRKAIDHLKKMKAILLGGSSIPTNLIQKSIENDFPIFTSYGSTEMASQITTTLPNEKVEKLNTSGKLLGYHQLKITNGEILVKGDALFKGYISGGKINSNLDSKGWFATGDLGFLDSEGYLTTTERKDNMFISGAENIHPEEIEKELCEMEGVKEAIVVPVKNEEYGNRPIAFIDIAGKFPERKFFDRFLEKKIPRFKIPDYFFPLPDEKQNADIKPNRLTLKKLAEEIILKES